MHPNTAALLEFFTYDHLPPHLAAVSKPFAELAQQVAKTLDGPEVTVCLRKLLESKDCAVRALVVATRGKTSPSLPQAGTDDSTPPDGLR